jgi:hypothetical protein
MDGNKMHPLMTARLDLGDKYSYLCLIYQEGGEVMEEGRDKRRTLRSSLQHPSSAPKAAGGGAGSSLKRDWEHRESEATQEVKTTATVAGRC